jgi:hypothetical protein
MLSVIQAQCGYCYVDVNVELRTEMKDKKIEHQGIE